MKNFKNVNLKRSKSKAGVYMIIATYPNGTTKLFSNTKDAKEQISFESEKKLF